MKENETHNARFAELQTEYLKTRSKKTLGEMYSVCSECLKNYLRSYERKHNFTFSDDDFKDRLQDACLFVITKYLTKPDFKIEKLSAYAYYGFLKACFNQKLLDKDKHETSFEVWAETELAREIEFD